MIVDEVRDALNDLTDDGSRMNELADQFRRGRDVEELIVLLDSPEHEVISMGAWILGELLFELYNDEKILSRLHLLTEHPDPLVRFHALGALFPALNPDDASTQRLLKRLLSDPNEGVRKAAEAAARGVGGRNA